VLGVENVGSRRVVDDDGVLEVVTNLGQIFHIVALVVIAALTEKAMVDNLVDVQLIEKRIAILGHRGGKDDNLIELTNSLHELVDSWSLDYIDIMIVALNLHWYREVGLVQNLEGAVNECFI